MITRSVFVKLVVFAVVTALGITYLATRYLGVGQELFGGGYTAYVDLADSGGIFTSASVTYRGVEVGRVGGITLHGDGIRVALNLDGSHRIPADARAVVGNGSPIGEQYLDLQPVHRGGPYLHDGSVIPEQRTALPVTTQQLLVDVDTLVRSVPRDDLRTVVDELGRTFDGTGPALRTLLDSSQQLVATARQNLPATSALIRDADTVLTTQNDLGNSIVDFSRHLASFTDQLRASDGDLRRVLQQGPLAATQVVDVTHGIEVTLPVLLENLVSVGQVTAVRVPALRQVLVIYPYIVATSFGLFPGDGTTRFGVPVPPAVQSQPCTLGYLPPSQRRLPSELNYPPIRWDSYCKAATNANVGVRGARMAPEPGGGRLGDDPGYRNNDGLPKSNGTTGAAGAGSAAGSSYLLGSTGGQQRLSGEGSWTWLILGPLS